MIRALERLVIAIIPTWQRRDLLREALRSLDGQGFAHVWVVDNGSTDGSAEMAGDWGARVIRLERNEGFAKAVNRGIQGALVEAGTGAWIAILNNDVELAPGWLERLLDGARPEDWFLNGKLYQAGSPGTLDGTFDLICRGGVAWRAGFGRRDGAVWNESRRIGFPSFTAGLFRADLFQRVGLLDESFGSYYEDVDFGLRCALEGLSGRYVPEAHGVHRGSATLGAWRPDTVRWIARNQKLLSRKHGIRGAWFAQWLWGLLAARNGCWPAWLAGRREGSATPVTSPEIPDPRMEELLRASERELHELQRISGFDRYWRIYFRWAGAPR
jgi:GT2 family glycosyltransferase